MVLVVLVLGLALDLANAQFNLHIAVGKNYNMARISGVWHLVSMASDNMTYIEEKGDLRLFIRNIQFLNNSNLQFHFHIMIHGECVAVTVVCEKTKNSGEFSIAYEGENKVLLVETDYTMYAIFHMQNIKNGTRTQVLALYGRFMQIDETYQERFENICKLYGLGSQNIIDMTNKDVKRSQPGLLVCEFWFEYKTAAPGFWEWDRVARSWCQKRGEVHLRVTVSCTSQSLYSAHHWVVLLKHGNTQLFVEDCVLYSQSQGCSGAFIMCLRRVESLAL